ncbi:MAG: hypothetical protein PQJ60_10280 [Spirochaetales bacterium]|nr:hypothetical protein [Spirochaetales bacterium]
MTEQALDRDKQAQQNRNIMIFILVMSMSGLENLIAELMPELQIGVLELGVSTFYFVPFALAMIFGTWWAALAVPVGEIVFSDLILGEFGGLGEFEEVLLVTAALTIVMRIVKDPSNRRQLFIAAIVGYFLSEMAGTFIDILKVWVGVEEFEAVPGLPKSIVVLEMLDFLSEFIISGILLGAIPAMYLTPRLYGKIEPLMGLEPRKPDDPVKDGSTKVLIIFSLASVVLATVIALLAEAGVSLVEWEPEFLDTLGSWFLWVAIAAAAAAGGAVLMIQAKKRAA